MNVQEIKKKQKNLSFFLSYLDISKISIFKKLKEENTKLNNIVRLKNVNISFLDKLSSQWKFVADRMHEKENDEKIVKNKSTLYILVDPKTINKISTQMLKKLSEEIGASVSKQDYVLTFGAEVNLIAQKQELNIIENYPYELFEDDKKFSNLLTSIVEMGTKNNIFTSVKLLLSEFSRARKSLTAIQIFPLDLAEKVKSIATSNSSIDEQDGEVEIVANSSSRMKSLKLYEEFFSNVDIKKIKWEPNIDFILDSFIDAITKQIIYEMRTRVLIDQLSIELQLIEDKKTRLMEQQDDLKLKWNRIRKEEATTQSLLLFSAFNSRKDEEPLPLFKKALGGEKN